MVSWWESAFLVLVVGAVLVLVALVALVFLLVLVLSLFSPSSPLFSFLTLILMFCCCLFLVLI